MGKKGVARGSTGRGGAGQSTEQEESKLLFSCFASAVRKGGR